MTSRSRSVAWFVAALVVLVGLWQLTARAGVLDAVFGASEHRSARDTYNDGVAALAKPDYEAAEKALLEARSNAGNDPELRFRAAYDLGFAYGSHAEQLRNGKDPDLNKALALAEQAVQWLGDALRLRPADADAKKNLGIMRARVQAISDELRKGEGKLEARLDRLINDQRSVLDDARAAWVEIKQLGGAAPLAQQSPLTHLADRERGIGAEGGVVADLAADEIDAIGKKPEDKRSDEEKVRVVQLKNLDLYLIEARSRITEARRKLQELAAEDGVGRAEAALIALKRAREQLLDPITVLKQLAQDELAIARETALAGAADPKSGLAKGPAPELPAWLGAKAIAERQTNVRDRLEEVRARLTAATFAPPQDPNGAAPKPDPAHDKLVERVKAALPAVGDASTAMERARDALNAAQLAQAGDQQQAALEALARAIEQFAELKQLVELAWGEHQQLVKLLGPEGAKLVADKQLEAAQRAKQSHDALAHNLARMPRLQALIADELAQLEAKAQQPPPADPKADPKAVEAQAAQMKQQAEQAKQQMQHAETLRAQAATALAALEAALAKSADPMPSAKDADAKLTELRQLFFSVIEHLQELIRTQGETRDQTSSANNDDDLARQPKLPGLVDRQDGHNAMAKAITDALAKQADEAAKQAPPQGPTPPQQGPDPKALAGAADELRQAQTDMGDAHGTLTKARDNKTQSTSLTPAVTSQGKAIEHLEAALKLLQPPPQKNDQDKQKQDQQQQQQQQQQQDKKPEQQQGGAGQRARDEDARRQRARQAPTNDPVEKDW